MPNTNRKGVNIYHPKILCAKNNLFIFLNLDEKSFDKSVNEIFNMNFIDIKLFFQKLMW